MLIDDPNPLYAEHPYPAPPIPHTEFCQEPFGWEK